MDVQRLIVHYLNLIEYQNRIAEKVRKLKYLKDRFLLRESSDIKTLLLECNPVWMEGQDRPRIKLSPDFLRNNDDV